MPFLKPKRRVLLLDDDPSMQRLIAGLLKTRGHRVDVVSSGDEAIRSLSRFDYDALLLDVMTPTEGGLTVIRHLRMANPAMLRRVVLVTASPHSVLRSVASEISGIVHKPFEPAVLLSAIEDVVKAA